MQRKWFGRPGRRITALFAAGLFIVAVALLLILDPSSSLAAEPWADPQLPVRNGLTLWLDAARASGGEPHPADGPLGQWRDASGAGRHVLQSDAQAQPALVKVGELAVVRFDGADDRLRAVNKQATELKSFTLVLLAGPQDHGTGEHDYPAWQREWAKLLAAADGVEIITAWEWPAADDFQTADVIVFYQRGDWNAALAAQIDAFLERGGGLVYIHWAVDGRESRVEKAKRIGLASDGSISYRHGDLTLMFNRATNHPIIRNFDTLALIDESYWKLTGSLPPNRILGTAVEEGEPQPQLWTTEPGQGRVFVSIPGHYSWTFDDPLFRVLLLRGIAWTARQPVDRFNDLVWPSAELAQ
jgi:type 1 glutamine amidotransferase